MKCVKPLTLYKELLKWKPRQGRLLGLDFNDKYVNLAVSDPDNVIAVPLSPLHRQENNMDFMVDKFQTLISEHNLMGFVVGYPYMPTLERSYGGLIKIFMDDLCKTGKFNRIKYAFWDDLIATKHMDFQLKHIVKLLIENFNFPQDKSEEVFDMCIAARILQAYLDCSKMTFVELPRS